MEKLFEMIKQNSYNDIEKDVIILGDVLEIRINDDRMDVYKYKDLDDVDIEEYDFDSDYLTTIYF